MSTTRKICTWIAAIVVALIASFFWAAHAKADNTTEGNTWNFNMTDPNKDGMEIHGIAGSLKQILEVKDPYGAPIFSVGHVGGANVYGDDLRVFSGSDIFNPVAVIHPDGSIEITSKATNPVVTINGQSLTANDIAWIHSKRGCGSNC